MTPDDAVQVLSATIDARDWDALARLLAPGFVCRYVHTGETFDAEAYVRLNREYPGAWAFTWEDAVVGADRAAGRARVSDGTETYHVAMFLRLRDGLLHELVEVWTDGVVEPPADRRPA